MESGFLEFWLGLVEKDLLGTAWALFGVEKVLGCALSVHYMRTGEMDDLRVELNVHIANHASDY